MELSLRRGERAGGAPDITDSSGTAGHADGYEGSPGTPVRGCDVLTGCGTGLAADTRFCATCGQAAAS